MKSLFYKVDNLIQRGRIGQFNLTRMSLICIIILFAILLYNVSLNIIDVKVFNIMIGIMGIIIPLIILDFLGDKNEEKMRYSFTNTILQLKNYADIQNDVIFSFKSVEKECLEPFKTLIKEFVIHINSGMDVVQALKNLKEKIDLKIGKIFCDNLIFCYLYGGDYRDLLGKTYITLSEINEEQKKRIQDTKSAIMILYFMIIINIYIFFSFIKSNPTYLDILEKTFIGNVIICMNGLGIIASVWISIIIKRIDK